MNHIAIITSIVFTLAINVLQAQPRKGNFINASVGYGLSSTYYIEDEDIGGSGFYAQGEYVFGFSKWFGLRPYAGVIFTSPDEVEHPENEKYNVTTNAFLMGGKARLSIPLPYVAPYVELGIGASLGKFVTYTKYNNYNKQGLLYHIPFTIGLALGRNNDVEFAFAYYHHLSVEQFSGAAAIGFSIPVNKTKS